MKKSSTALLSLAALGVVYGDIGTSPLYALREGFVGSTPFAVTQANVLGVLSLVFWALLLVICVKYVGVILRADHKGEGGILALMSLASHGAKRRAGLLMLGLFGAALLYGDGMITPAISVLSAVEGVELAAPSLAHFVIPITIAILLALFALQRRGTAVVGALFGPITLVWFGALAVLGVSGILRAPGVLAAIDPIYALRFFAANGLRGALILGGVFLVVTGGEALYADMGHFGRKPIRWAWFAVVLPALLLNYFGQGALLLRDPSALENPFYLLAPSWALLPLILLATMATVIASQAVISGAFSLTMQAVQLDLCPRLKVRHTSEEERGQIYMPQVNAALCVGAVILVLSFGSSAALAGAYGIAVALTMAITTLLLYPVARVVWGWSRPRAILVAGAFLLVDLAFVAANAPKIVEGGWVPLAIALAVYVVAVTWVKGRSVAKKLLSPGRVPLATFLDGLNERPAPRVPGTAIFPVTSPDTVPLALTRNLQHNKVLHEHVVLLSIQVDEAPHVPEAERVAVTPMRHGFTLVTARYGFTEEPDVPSLLAAARAQGLRDDPDDATFFLERERFVATRLPSGMAYWREHLFALLSRIAQPPAASYRIPSTQIVEMGGEVRLELPELIAAAAASRSGIRGAVGLNSRGSSE